MPNLAIEIALGVKYADNLIGGKLPADGIVLRGDISYVAKVGYVFLKNEYFCKTFLKVEQNGCGEVVTHR